MKPTPHYLKSLGMCIPAVLIGLQLSAWIGFVLSPERQNRADFRAYYYAGEILRSGRPHHLYDSYDRSNITSAFIHPAYEAALFVPLTFFSVRTAHAVWIAINLGILALISRLLNFSVGNVRALLWWLPAAILASFLPVSECLMQGQDSLLLLLLIVMAFERLRREELFLAGALVGLGTFRFQFLAIVVLLFLLWKCWNFVAGFCSSAICMILVSTALVGIEGQRQYLRLLEQIADSGQQPVLAMTNLRAVVTAFGSASPIYFYLLCLASLLAVAWSGRHGHWDARLLMSTAAACLLSYHAFLHDLSLLVAPLIVTCDRALAQGKYLHVGILALVLALPTLLAITGEPLWVNSFASATMLVEVGLLQSSFDTQPTSQHILVGVGQ